MITFILNNNIVNSDKPEGTSLLDFIRYEMDLPGTKIGCREGDCGACTVLEGALHNGKVKYKTIVSCLTPLANVHRKHIVTIEGINMEQLSPVQESIVKNSATQCGFCTPGIVMSLTSHCLSGEKSDIKTAVASVSGNICRCTGYKSIEKAAEDISGLLKNKGIVDPVKWLVKNRFLPGYFIEIPGRLAKIKDHKSVCSGKIIAGGTDIMVRKPEELAEENINSIYDRKDLKVIFVSEGNCIIGAAATASEIVQSATINNYIPDIPKYFRLISSEPIRNMGTVGGNIVNASPIGDLTIIFLALNARLRLKSPGGERAIPLQDFFLGYKKLKIKKGEYIINVAFPLPQKPVLFNFEKVSKRTHLDIASVNSAIQIIMDGERIGHCFVSAGGVSPVPLFLAKCSGFLKGKKVIPETIFKANEIMQGEISPISDVRGSHEYKRLLIRQLFFAHFLTLFPQKISSDDLFN